MPSTVGPGIPNTPTMTSRRRIALNGTAQGQYGKIQKPDLARVQGYTVTFLVGTIAGHIRSTQTWQAGDESELEARPQLHTTSSTSTVRLLCEPIPPGGLSSTSCTQPLSTKTEVPYQSCSTFRVPGVFTIVGAIVPSTVGPRGSEIWQAGDVINRRHDRAHLLRESSSNGGVLWRQRLAENAWLAHY